MEHPALKVHRVWQVEENCFLQPERGSRVSTIRVAEVDFTVRASPFTNFNLLFYFPSVLQSCWRGHPGVEDPNSALEWRTRRVWTNIETCSHSLHWHPCCWVLRALHSCIHFLVWSQLHVLTDLPIQHIPSLENWFSRSTESLTLLRSVYLLGFQLHLEVFLTPKLRTKLILVWKSHAIMVSVVRFIHYGDMDFVQRVAWKVFGM